MFPDLQIFDIKGLREQLNEGQPKVGTLCDSCLTFHSLSFPRKKTKDQDRYGGCRRCLLTSEVVVDTTEVSSSWLLLEVVWTSRT